MSNTISEHCIYTIKYREELEGKIGKPATFSERKSWVTGERLWQQAKAAKKAMPVLLGDATNCSRLLCWGILTNVRVNSNGTSFSVERLRDLRGKHSTEELILRSTGKKIQSNFSRPYLICRTPEFLTS